MVAVWERFVLVKRAGHVKEKRRESWNSPVEWDSRHDSTTARSLEDIVRTIQGRLGQTGLDQTRLKKILTSQHTSQTHFATRRPETVETWSK